MKKVLITGVDSFTGNYLSSYLSDDSYDIYGTSLFKRGEKKYRCDITKKEDIIAVLREVSPDFILHLSGISFPAHGDMQEFYGVNSVGALNILDALVELNMHPEKVILVSSATVYGNQGLSVLDESLCPMPANHYGASKYVMESLARNYFEKLNIIITRPFNYTASGQAEHFLIPKIVKHFRAKEEFIELGNLDVEREFNDIGFVCEVYKRLLESDIKSEIVNIASNRAIKLLDVIEMMQEIAKYKIEVRVNPAFVRKDEIKSLSGSPKKLFNLIGQVEQVAFKETLRGMFEA